MNILAKYMFWSKILIFEHLTFLLNERTFLPNIWLSSRTNGLSSRMFNLSCQTIDDNLDENVKGIFNLLWDLVSYLRTYDKP